MIFYKVCQIKQLTNLHFTIKMIGEKKKVNAWLRGISAHADLYKKETRKGTENILKIINQLNYRILMLNLCNKSRTPQALRGQKK